MSQSGGTGLKEKNGEHPFGDAGQLVLLVLFLIVWVYDSFIWHKSTFLSDDVSVYVRLLFTVLILVVSIYLFKSSHFIAQSENRPDGVVSSGVFHHVRHPLYLGAILFYLGLVISTLSLFTLLLFGVIFIFYNFIAGYEEKLLEAKFGEAYLEYKKKTGRWLPG